MNNLQIDAGTVRLTVNDDPARVIEFNPTDVLFVERFYRLMRLFDEKHAEYMQRAEGIAASTGVDALGIPDNVDAGIALLREACTFLREQIDVVFGAGTSQAAFGDALNLEVFEQFFYGVAPYIEQAMSKRIKPYVGSSPSNVMR